MGVSKNRWYPKWMVKIMENHIKMDDLGYPYSWKHPYTLGAAASQDASDHQNYGIPINLHLSLLLGGGHTQDIPIEP